MPALYILDIPEFAPILHTARIAGMTEEELDGYVKVSTAAPEIVLERRHTDVRPAVWFAALTGGLEGRIVRFDFDVLHLAEGVRP
ncbi:hypothetical protein ACWEP8_23075 [Streptomyces hydrogenans]|uniref:hypothetical protein n=1 Tax=Streptomyces hydrogenans TaxID=1873719 RepID=UPI00331719B3